GAFLCLDIVYGVTGADDMLRLWLASSLPMSFQMDFALLPSFPRLLGFPADHDDHFFIASYRFLDHNAQIYKSGRLLNSPFSAKPFNDFIGSSFLNHDGLSLDKHDLSLSSPIYGWWYSLPF